VWVDGDSRKQTGVGPSSRGGRVQDVSGEGRGLRTSLYQLTRDRVPYPKLMHPRTLHSIDASFLSSATLLPQARSLSRPTLVRETNRRHGWGIMLEYMTFSFPVATHGLFC
jgi:hypothetical protein